MAKLGLITLFLLLWPLLYAYCLPQETFGNIYTGLDELDKIVDDMELQNESLKNELRSLSRHSSMLEEYLTESEQALIALRQSQSTMSQAYKQLELQYQASVKKSNTWRTLSICGVTVGVSGIIAGIIIVAVN